MITIYPLNTRRRSVPRRASGGGSLSCSAAGRKRRFAVIAVSATQAGINGASFPQALKAGAIGGAIGGATGVGLGVVGAVVASFKSPAVSLAYNLALTGSGAYSTVQGFQNGQYLVGAVGVVMLAFALKGLADSVGALGDQNQNGSISDGSPGRRTEEGHIALEKNQRNQSGAEIASRGLTRRDLDLAADALHGAAELPDSFEATRDQVRITTADTVAALDVPQGVRQQAAHLFSGRIGDLRFEMTASPFDRALSIPARLPHRPISFYRVITLRGTGAPLAAGQVPPLSPTRYYIPTSRGVVRIP